MKGPALIIIVGSILVGCFQLSSAAPATSDDHASITYQDFFSPYPKVLTLTNNSCINFEAGLKRVSFYGTGSNSVSVYGVHNCKGAATVLKAPRSSYKGRTVILSVKRNPTP